MPSEFSLTGDLEPFTITILECQHLTGESRSQIYVHLGNGTYQAVKSGARTLIIYESVKRRIAALPPAKFSPPKPRKHVPAASRRPRGRRSK